MIPSMFGEKGKTQRYVRQHSSSENTFGNLPKYRAKVMKTNFGAIVLETDVKSHQYKCERVTIVKSDSLIA